MPIVKTDSLIGTALDWAVAVCEKEPIRHDPMRFERGPNAGFFVWDELEPSKPRYEIIGRDYSPTTNWMQGGPLIDKIKGFQLKVWVESEKNSLCETHIHNYDGDYIAFGPTILVSAMRCYVKSIHGNTIDIPPSLAV